MDKIRIIFFGTPEFSKIVLEKLIQTGFEICAVVTAPDKPVGRKQTLTPPPVKILAQENLPAGRHGNIPVLQPVKLDENFINELRKLNPDLHVVASYGKIIPQAVLDIPKHGNINVHPSLLPKYRGASPIQSVLLNGDRETGVTIMLMDEKMDHGKIMNNEKLKIMKNEKFKELHDKLASLGAELLVKTIPDYLSGKIKPQEQNHEQATFCKIIKKFDGQIDWSKSAEEIYNQWRAFCEWPGVFAQLTVNNQQPARSATPARQPDGSHGGGHSVAGGLKIKFIEFKITDVQDGDKRVGKFFVKDKQLYVVCGNGTVLQVLKLQPEGKKIMDAQSFINGYLKRD